MKAEEKARLKALKHGDRARGGGNSANGSSAGKEQIDGNICINMFFFSRAYSSFVVPQLTHQLLNQSINQSCSAHPNLAPPSLLPPLFSEPLFYSSLR